MQQFISPFHFIKSKDFTILWTYIKMFIGGPILGPSEGGEVSTFNFGWGGGSGKILHNFGRQGRGAITPLVPLSGSAYETVYM
jgi:hypothetical protein